MNSLIEALKEVRRHAVAPTSVCQRCHRVCEHCGNDLIGVAPSLQEWAEDRPDGHGAEVLAHTRRDFVETH